MKKNRKDVMAKVESDIRNIFCRLIEEAGLEVALWFIAMAARNNNVTIVIFSPRGDIDFEPEGEILFGGADDELTEPVLFKFGFLSTPDLSFLKQLDTQRDLQIGIIG